MADSGTRERAARLAQIRAETANKLGYTDPDAIGGADRERLELASALILQREIETARLLAGHAIGTDALVKLSEAISGVLPAHVTPRPFERPTLTEADLEKDLPWRLERLNDAELDELLRLCAVAQGRAEPVRNTRLDAALALARQLDEIERENGGVASDEQINLLRGDVQSLLFPVCTLGVFAEPYTVAAPSDTARETRVDGAVPLSEGQSVPARASNVVRMPSRDASWAVLVGD